MRAITLNMIRGTIVDEDEIEVTKTVSVTVNADHVRSFNPRREGRPGTRITFVNGSGFAVTEDYAQVGQLLA